MAPVGVAGLNLTNSCQFVDPANLPADCRDFVSTLERVSPALVDVMGRIVAVDRALPSDAPPEVKMLFAEFISVLDLMARSDQTILEGWFLQDFAIWGNGWDLRREASAALASYLEGAGENVVR